MGLSTGLKITYFPMTNNTIVDCMYMMSYVVPTMFYSCMYQQTADLENAQSMKAASVQCSFKRVLSILLVMTSVTKNTGNLHSCSSSKNVSHVTMWIREKLLQLLTSTSVAG